MRPAELVVEGAPRRGGQRMPDHGRVAEQVVAEVVPLAARGERRGGAARVRSSRRRGLTSMPVAQRPAGSRALAANPAGTASGGLARPAAVTRAATAARLAGSTGRGSAAADRRRRRTPEPTGSRRRPGRAAGGLRMAFMPPNVGSGEALRIIKRESEIRVTRR